MRPKEDLAVTRFYTTLDIYSAMRNIHVFDSALRETFEQGHENASVVFLRADPTRGVIPCSPNKILLSTVITIRPESRFLPVGFLTDDKSRALKHVRTIDAIVQRLDPGDNDQPFRLGLKDAEVIIDRVSDALVMDPGCSWDAKAFKAILGHLANLNPAQDQRGHVVCLVRKNRSISKYPPGTLDRLQSAPDSLVERNQVARFQGGGPALLLYRQNGKAESGWSDCPFWWPVLRAPSNSPTVIFAINTVD